MSSTKIRNVMTINGDRSPNVSKSFYSNRPIQVTFSIVAFVIASYSFYHVQSRNCVLRSLNTSSNIFFCGIMFVVNRLYEFIRRQVQSASLASIIGIDDAFRVRSLLQYPTRLLYSRNYVLYGPMKVATNMHVLYLGNNKGNLCRLRERFFVLFLIFTSFTLLTFRFCVLSVFSNSCGVSGRRSRRTNTRGRSKRRYSGMCKNYFGNGARSHYRRAGRRGPINLIFFNTCVLRGICGCYNGNSHRSSIACERNFSVVHSTNDDRSHASYGICRYSTSGASVGPIVRPFLRAIHGGRSQSQARGSRGRT